MFSIIFYFITFTMKYACLAWIILITLYIIFSSNDAIIYNLWNSSNPMTSFKSFKFLWKIYNIFHTFENSFEVFKFIESFVACDKRRQFILNILYTSNFLLINIFSCGFCSKNANSETETAIPMSVICNSNFKNVCTICWIWTFFQKSF